MVNCDYFIWFANAYLLFAGNGFCNKILERLAQGKTVIPFIYYDDLEVNYGYDDEYVLLKTQDKWGIKDFQNKTLLPATIL